MEWLSLRSEHLLKGFFFKFTEFMGKWQSQVLDTHNWWKLISLIT